MSGVLSIFYTIWDWCALDGFRVFCAAFFLLCFCWLFVTLVVGLVKHLVSPFRKQDIKMEINNPDSDPHQIARRVLEALGRQPPPQEPDRRPTRLEALNEDD